MKQDDTPPPTDPSDPSAGNLSELLARHRGALIKFIERNAQGLLKHETADDLAQGIHLRAMKQVDQFEYRGEREFLAWLYVVGKQHIGDRHDYWSALRRDAGNALRITVSDASASESGGVNPPTMGSGPATFAMRRELVEIASRTIACLLPRDQQVIRATCRGDSIADIAKELGIAYDAAEKAKARAFERFKKTFELVSRNARPS